MFTSIPSSIGQTMTTGIFRQQRHAGRLCGRVADKNRLVSAGLELAGFGLCDSVAPLVIVAAVIPVSNQR
jgi:hypothetical protein